VSDLPDAKRVLKVPVQAILKRPSDRSGERNTRLPHVVPNRVTGPDGRPPKQHTPQTGLTFRSMSHHLALVPAGEIRRAVV